MEPLAFMVDELLRVVVVTALIAGVVAAVFGAAVTVLGLVAYVVWRRH